MNAARTIAILLSILLCTGRAFAWNSTGHMAIALFAWRQLDRSQRQGAHTLLRAHPHYQRYLAEKRPDDVPEDEWAFLRAATWPDWVREGHEHSNSDLKPYHHANWHYINLPYVASGEERVYAAATIEPTAPNVVTALNEALAVLIARHASAPEQAIRFCWVLHLVGDIHQPLHCASLISRRYPPPKGDEGGNLLAITPHKRAESLHSYWDRLLGTNSHDRALEQLVNRITSTAEHDGDIIARLRTHTTVQSWADEGFEVAVAFAYDNGRLPMVDFREVERGELPASAVPVLPAGYASTARDVARRQAYLGGQRLTAVVKEIVARR